MSAEIFLSHSTFFLIEDLLMFRSISKRSFYILGSSFLFGRSTKNENEKTVEIDRTPMRNVQCTGFECLREASMITLSSCSSFLKQTIFYYSELSENYCKTINGSIEILDEFDLRQNEIEVRDEIWRVFVEHRSKIEEMKKELIRLRLLFSTIERLVSESIEAGYQTQDEVSTQIVATELQQSKMILDQKEKMIFNHERLFTEQQIKSIEKSPSSS